MIRLNTTPLARIRDRLREEATAVPLFQSLDFRTEQEDLAFRRGFDGGRGFGEETELARRNRWGYYRKKPRSNVSSVRPFGVWTGKFLRSTYGVGTGRKRIRVGLMTIRAMRNRPVRNPWDLVSIDKALGVSFRARLQKVLDGKRPARRVSVLRAGR